MPKSARATSVRPLPTSPPSPEDLAASHTEADVAELAPARQATHFEQNIPRHRLAARIECRELAADHQADGPVPRKFGGELDPNEQPVAKHGDAVGDAKDLVHAVTDEHHGDVLAAQPLDHLEQPLDLALGEGRGGLVHDQRARLQRQGAGDFDELLFRGPQAAQFRLHVDRQADRGEDVLGFPRHRDVIEAAPAPPRHVPHEHVLDHA